MRLRFLRRLVHLIDVISYRFEGHWPDDYLDCPSDCKRCARIERRNARIWRFLHEHELPRAYIERGR